MRRLAFILTLAAFAVNGQPAQTYFQQGNDHFQKAAYAEAIAAYENALATGYESAELYFNLGNAYFKSDQLGKTILNYERAHRLVPHDEDVTFNLELAQLRVVDKLIVPPPFFLDKVWNAIKHVLSVNQWAVLSVAGFNFLVILLMVRLLVAAGRLRSLAGYLFLPLLIITFLGTLLFWANRQEAVNLRYGIIMAQKVSVLSAPSGDGTEVFSLHEGTKVRIEEQSGGYQKISLPDGKVGWMNMRQVEKI